MGIILLETLHTMCCQGSSETQASLHHAGRCNALMLLEVTKGDHMTADLAHNVLSW